MPRDHAPRVCRQALAWLVVSSLCTAGTTVSAMDNAELDAERAEAPALALRLLPALCPYTMHNLRLSNVRGARFDHEWYVYLLWEDDAGKTQSVDCKVDLTRGEIKFYTGEPLTGLAEDTPEGRLKEAEGFARAHLGPFTDRTRLISSHDVRDLGTDYLWANVLDSGAWTGDWWSVTISANRRQRGVTSFSRQRAPREVAEAEVVVGRERALEIAETRLPPTEPGAENQPVDVLDARLLLSSPNSPTGGPVWHIAMARKPGGQPYAFTIDGMTGQIIGP